MVNVLDKLPPQNLEAERGVLGSILIDKESVYKVLDFLDPADFYSQHHQIIFQGIKELVSQRTEIDLLTLSDNLESRELLHVIGGKEVLAELTLEIPTSSHIFEYASIVKNKATLRKIIRLGNDIIACGYEQDRPIEEVMEDTEKKLFAVTHSYVHDQFVHIKNILHKRYEEFAELHDKKGEGIVKGLPTGFADLDSLLTGMKPSDLIVLAARPSMGKTAFALNLAQNIAIQQSKVVGIFSLEMSKDQLVDRMFASLMMVDSWKMHKGKLSDEDFSRMGEVMSILSTAPIFIDDASGSSVGELKSKARRLKMEKGLDLIVIDYMQLMAGNNPMNRVQELSEISRSLKELARELHIPVIALSQLSRNVEGRPSKIPQLSDLRDSGSIEQDADIVMMLYRDEYYEPDTDKKGIAEIYIKKNRNGPVGKVDMRFVPEQMRFYDLDVRRVYEGAEFV